MDFALGSDTGGSVRIPASYCGLFGIRPTHGAITLAGACPLAPSLDTLGWFTREAALLARIGAVLLPADEGATGGPLLRVTSAWSNAEPAVAEAARPAMEALETLLGPAIGINLIPEGLDTLHAHFRALQAQEAWAALGAWVEHTAPAFGPGVGERFAAAKAMDPALAAAGRAFRRVLRARVRSLLAGGGVMIYPTSPCTAPLLSASLAEQDRVRQATIRVTAIAGFCGLPEISLPVGVVDGAPVGVSLVAAPGRDRALLALAIEAAKALGLPV